jgi:hypothetical protein
MLAAMIGSTKLVTFLLEKRASWDMKDKSGSLAVDYVEGPFAEEMRVMYKRLTKRNSSRSVRQKQQIKLHLSNTSVLKTQYRTDPTGTLLFQRHGSSLKVSKLIAKVDAAISISQNATAACIAPGTAVKPWKCAVSGWSAASSRGVLDGAKYTQVVRDMAEILDVDLPRHCYDTPGGGSLEQNVGRFYAVCRIFLHI